MDRDLFGLQDLEAELEKYAPELPEVPEGEDGKKSGPVTASEPEAEEGAGEEITEPEEGISEPEEGV